MARAPNFGLDPTKANANGTTSYVEGGVAVLLAANAVVNATGNFRDETLTISGLLPGDQIGFASGVTVAGNTIKIGHNKTASFTGGTNGADLVITFDHGVVAKDVEALLRNLTFINSSENPATHALTIGFGGTIQTELVNVTPVNDAPIVDLNGAAAGTLAVLSYTENGMPKAIAPNANVSDMDSADFNGGALTVAFAANGTSADQLTIGNQATGAGKIGVSGNTITYGGITIGTFTGGTNGTALTVAFNSSAATAGAAQALLRDILYSNNSDDPLVAPRTISYTLNDGDGTANGGANIGSATATINITAVNDGPVGVNDAGSATEMGGTSNGSGGTSATGNVLGNDTDVDNTNLSFAVAAIRTGTESGTGNLGTLGMALVGAHGALTLSGDGTYSYAVNENDAAVQALNKGHSLVDIFTYTVSDSGGLIDTAELVITINGADDAPVTTRVSLVAIAEDSGTRLITQAELLANASDIDSPALTATGLAIASGAGDLADNGNGTWSYAPAPNDDTAVVFSYTVTDGTSTASGSAALDITPVDDPDGLVIKLTEPVSGSPGQISAHWSNDGSRLFLASSSTLTADDADGGNGTDLFAVDLANGDKTLLTASVADGWEGDSWFEAANPNATKLVLGSTSTLAPDDTDGGAGTDLYLVDLATGQKTLLTAPVSGGAGSGQSSFVAWSPDGTKLLLQSDSTLTSDDTDGGIGSDLFAVDLSTGQKTLLTGPIPGGAQGFFSIAGWSPDGAKLVIQSTATLTEDDTDGGVGSDVFVVDVATWTKTLLTGGAAGSSLFKGWTPDGTKVILASNASLTPDDSSGTWDVFAVNAATGVKTLLTAPVVASFNDYSEVAGGSPDGTTLLIGSSSSLTANDTDGAIGQDLFAVDLVTGQKTLLTESAAGGSQNFSSMEGWSPDGARVAIGSTSTLTADDADGGDWDLFAVNVANGEKILLTAPAAGGAEGDFRFAGWSPDGTKLLLASTSTLTSDDTDGSDVDLFAVDLATGEKTLLTGSIADGFEGDSDFVFDVTSSSMPVWSSDGRSIRVVTSSTLVDGDLDNGGIDLYWIEITSGAKSLDDLGLDFAPGQYAWGEGTPSGGPELVGLWTDVTDYYLFT